MAQNRQPRRPNFILAKDVQRITKLPWSTIQWWIWRSSFKWDKTGKQKLGRTRQGRLDPVMGKRFSPRAVWDVNDFLNFHPKVFERLAQRRAWSRLHYDLNDFAE
jgi:hypothetical protein